MQALALWRSAVVGSVRRDDPDLSARQFAVLLTVYLGQPPHTVRKLALGLALAKPAVSRAVDRLEHLVLVRRLPDRNNRRSIIVGRTVKGCVYLYDFGEMVADAAASTADQ